MVKMRILLVEAALSGHRKTYHKKLIETIGIENTFLITPEEEPDVKCEQVIDGNIDLRPRTIRDYLRWLKFIKHTADDYRVDAIHFLDGDLLYRFCGYKLNILKNYKTIVTFHHVGEDFIHSASVNLILQRITYGVVHTEHLKKRFNNLHNIILIDYPYFPVQETIPDRKESKRYYGIDENKMVLLALGGTRYEKGVDILMKSLKEVKKGDVVLLIAGNEDYFKKSDLEQISTGNVAVYYSMKSLSDAEWCMALSASDIVVLPYRKSFAGASGPLTEAVWFEKPIIGKTDGSIGEMIRNNELGWTFEAENIVSLGKVIENAITTEFEIGRRYIDFKEKISISRFQEGYMKLYK